MLLAVAYAAEKTADLEGQDAYYSTSVGHYPSLYRSWGPGLSYARSYSYGDWPVHTAYR